MRISDWSSDVCSSDLWPSQRFDALFSANTLHIMGWPAVQALFAGLPAVLTDDAVVAIYGPFNRNGRHTSDGNAAFDAHLRAQAPAMGLRDAEAVDALALQAGFNLHAHQIGRAACGERVGEDG